MSLENSKQLATLKVLFCESLNGKFPLKIGKIGSFERSGAGHIGARKQKEKTGNELTLTEAFGKFPVDQKNDRHSNAEAEKWLI